MIARPNGTCNLDRFYNENITEDIHTARNYKMIKMLNSNLLHILEIHDDQKQISSVGTVGNGEMG